MSLENYHTKALKIIRDYLISALGAGILGWSGIFYFGLRENPYENSPIVQEAREIKESLQTLKDERTNLYLAIPYQTDVIKPYIDKVFQERKVKIDSLDKAIELTEKDLEERKKHSDFIVYANHLKNSSYNSLIIAAGTLLTVLGISLRWEYKVSKLKKPRQQELE